MAKDPTPVFINGEIAGQTPLRTHLPIGTYSIEVLSPDGKLRFTREVTLSPKRTTRIDFQLRGGPGARAPATETPERRAAAPPPAPVAGPTEDGGRRRIWTWITAGTAGVAALAGVIVWASSVSEFNDLEESYQDLRAAGEDETIEAMRDSIHAKDVAATVLLSAAGALVATSVVLFFLEGRPAAADPAAARDGVQVLPMAGGGLLLRGSF